MSKYRTAPHNFIGKFTEKTYSPDESLVKQLHAYLDMVCIINEPLAFAIDMVVADLMRVEGYGQPQRYRELSDPELLPTNNKEKET